MRQEASTALRLECPALKIQDYDYDIQCCEGECDIADPLLRFSQDDEPSENIMDKQCVGSNTEEQFRANVEV